MLQKSITCKKVLPHYYKLCARNKYAPQKPQRCHMPKLHDAHLLGKYANKYATNEVAPINDIVRKLTGNYTQDKHSTLPITKKICADFASL